VTKRERIDQDVLHRRAQVAVLSGLAAGDDVYDLMAAAAPSHVPGWFTPDVALLELAVTALDLACPAGAGPLEYEGLRERYLPEVTFRGRVEHRNSQYALYAAACMRGGLQPDLLSDAGWWQTPVAVRRPRRRHLQPRLSRATHSPGGGDRSADRRSARPRAHRVTTCGHVVGPETGVRGLRAGGMGPPGVTNS
jgi:hypothetical protein